jgi:hypothetical protein
VGLKNSLWNRIRGWLPTDFKPLQAKQTGRRSSFRLDRTNVGLLTVFTVSLLNAATQFLYDNAVCSLFIWFSCIVGFSLLLNILATKNVQVNIKLMLTAWFTVLSMGGVVVNVYLFSVPASFLTRVFSVTLFAVVHVPFIIALTANFADKKVLSKKTLDWFSPRS